MVVIFNKWDCLLARSIWDTEGNEVMLAWVVEILEVVLLHCYNGDDSYKLIWVMEFGVNKSVSALLEKFFKYDNTRSSFKRSTS